MNEFITYRDTNTEGELLYFVLQKDFPHFNCYISERPVVNFVQPMPITDYHLFLVFSGTIRGMMIPDYRNMGEEIQSVMQDMAAFYYEQRILKDLKKYRKWKI